MNDDGPDNHTLTLESFKIEGRGTPNGLEEAEEKLYEAVQYPWRKCQLPSGLPAGRTASNIVRAGFLRFLVLEGDGRSFVHEKGVHLDGAFIEGNLDFHGCEIKRPLFLTNCRFSGGLILEDALTCTVKLDGSVIPHIGAQRVRIRGGLYLQHCKLLGQVRLIDAEIAGSLECHGASLACGTGPQARAENNHIALYASRAKIAGSVFLHQHCHVKGEVSFRGAIIRGNLTCGSGRLSHPEGNALDCDGAQIGGNVSMDKDFLAHGCVWFNGAGVRGKFLCDGGVFRRGTGREARALSAKRARLDGSVYLRKADGKLPSGHRGGFVAIGEVNFVDAKIGGSLECHGGQFLNAGGNALYCSRAKVAGSVFLHKGFKAEGEVVFRSASVGSNFDASDSHFNTGTEPGLEHRDKKSLSCERMRVGGSFCLKGANVKRQICFIDTVIGGSLEGHGAKLDNPQGFALYCSRAKIAGSIFFIDSFSARGTVAFGWASIGANIRCDTSRFDGFDSPSGRAIDLDGASVCGSLLMGNGFEANGEVHIVNASIGGSVGCSGGAFSNVRPRGTPRPQEKNKPPADKPGANAAGGMCADALKLRGSTIKGSLWLGPSHTPPHDKEAEIKGALDLRDAQAGVLIDSEKSWPPESVKFEGKPLACPVFLDGFAYDRIGSPASLDLGHRKRWLERQPEDDLNTSFKAQAFEQLVRVLRGMGHIPVAHKIAVIKERRYTLRPLETRFVRGWPWWLSPERWARLLIFDVVAGYGYRAHRIVILVILVWFACGLAYLQAHQKGMVHPTFAGMHEYAAQACKNALAKRDTRQLKELSCPEFNAFRYSADVILPIIQQREKAAWAFEVGGWGTLADFLKHMENIFGWVAGLILAALLGHKINKE